MRTAEIKRKTYETDIALKLNIDGTGQSDIKTNVPFMSHMLELWTRHGFFDLEIEAMGDIEIDAHHTTEDMGISLGQAFIQALGNREGIRRYGHAIVPMDDALAEVVVDLSNRPHLEYRVELPSNRVGNFDLELVEEFMAKFTAEARINLHIIVHYGRNSHHIVEGIFKALARALDQASSYDERVQGVLSTKGKL